MITAETTERGTVELVERPAPRAVGDLVVVQVLIAPMCTENRKRRDGVADHALGHEAVGVVVDAGDSRRVRPGDRVAVMPHYGCGRCELCTSGDYMHCLDPRDVLAETGQESGTATYAQYLLKPDWLLLPIPDDISLTHAAMACCGFGPTFGALERMRVDALDVLLVSGCGPVGLGAVVQGAARGARVIAIEAHPYRAELARRLGAELVIDPMGEDVVARVQHTVRGADAAIETSGAAGAAAAAALAVRRRGRMSIVAWGADVALPPLVPLGLDVFGVWHWNSLRHADRMWRTIRRSRELIDAMVTHLLPLEEVVQAMDLQDSGRCGKVLLLPHGAPAALDGSAAPVPVLAE